MGGAEKGLEQHGLPTQCQLERPSGFATLFVALLLTLLSLYGLETYVKANVENRIAKREVQSRQAVFLAESGVEWTKGQLDHQPDFRAGSFELGSGTVTVDATPSEGGYWVRSVARAGMAERKIGVLLQNRSGHWQTVRYQELHQ